MTNVLDKIIANKRREVNERKRTMPLASFSSGLTVSDRCLYSALEQQPTGFILECKKASPSKGVRSPMLSPVPIKRTGNPSSR